MFLVVIGFDRYVVIYVDVKLFASPVSSENHVGMDFTNVGLT